MAMGTPETDVFHLIFNAGPMVRFVLLVLFVFSVASWTIIFFKYRQLRKARKESELFTEYFWRTGDLAKAFTKAKQLAHSPVARAFRVAYMEMTRLNQWKQENKENPGSDTPKSTDSLFVGKDNIERALRRATESELTRLTLMVPFLATTGNTAPFIGLFGTVWGIMNAFQGIGQRGSATLAVVAPGISEALVATAAGLVAAIPAVIAFNHFVNKVRMIESEMRNFASDFMNILEREMLRRKGG